MVNTIANEEKKCENDLFIAFSAMRQQFTGELHAEVIRRVKKARNISYTFIQILFVFIRVSNRRRANFRCATKKSSA